MRLKVCVLPHAFHAQHLADDAPESVGALADFLSERRSAEIGMAMKAMLSEEDLEDSHGLGMEEGENEVAAVFHNLLVEEVHLVRIDANDVNINEESIGAAKSGGSVVIIANTGDKFAAYTSDGQKEGSYTITAEGGGATDFVVPATSTTLSRALS